MHCFTRIARKLSPHGEIRAQGVQNPLFFFLWDEKCDPHVRQGQKSGHDVVQAAEPCKMQGQPLVAEHAHAVNSDAAESDLSLGRRMAFLPPKKDAAVT